MSFFILHLLTVMNADTESGNRADNAGLLINLLTDEL